MNITGRTALVTGASNGIGEHIVRQLADRGVNLAVVARSADKLEALKDDIARRHPELTVTVIVADLATPGAAELVADQVAGAGITVDLLFNNAGVGSHGKFTDDDPDALARQIQLNVGSLVALTARFLPAMVARGFGAVLNVASTAAFQPVPSMAVYGATKAFVLSFTEALWGETRGTGVRVVTLCPGATETAFFTNTGKEFLTSGRQTPDEVARVALRALDGGAPTVVSGLNNRLAATGYRFLPRALMVLVSGGKVKAAASLA